MSLKQNIVANYLGQGWAGLMALAFIPVYIRYLGVESYGLIGLFAVMQAWLTLLDLGMTPMLNREMARFTAGAHSVQSIRDLLRSVEWLCFSIAILICLGVWMASGWLAVEWLRPGTLPLGTLSGALSVAAVVIALRFVEGIYRGALFGLQQQVWFNAVNALLATLRWGGVIPVLAWLSPTIEAFLLVQALVSLLAVFVLAARVHQQLPRSALPPRFSRAALGASLQFAGGMMIITVLVLLLTQIDKILLSRLLTLESFGYYMLASTVAGGLYMLVGPIEAAAYPRMVELVTNMDEAELTTVYHQGAQLVTVLTAPVALLLAGYANEILFIWSGDSELASNTSPILAALAIGTFINTLMHMPYELQLAHGWTSLATKTNAVAVVVLIPAMLWVVPEYGSVGAAWIWVALNAGYITISAHLMHRRLLPAEKWRWYGSDIFLPVGAAAAALLIASLFRPADPLDRWSWAVFIVAAGTVSLATAVLLAGRLRSRVATASRAVFGS